MFLNTGSLFLRKSGSLTRLGECEGGCLWSIPAIPVCFCFSNGFHCDPVHSLNHAPMIFSNVPLDLPEQFEPVCGIVPWKAIRPFHRTFIIVYHSNMYRYISDILDAISSTESGVDTPKTFDSVEPSCTPQRPWAGKHPKTIHFGHVWIVS